MKTNKVYVSTSDIVVFFDNDGRACITVSGDEKELQLKVERLTSTMIEVYVEKKRKKNETCPPS